jgi:hypothetical protein
MKKLLAMVIGFGVLLALSTPAFAQDTAKKDSKKPEVIYTDVYEVTATVEVVDVKKRILILKAPSGDLMELDVDKSVKNFNQIKAGDEVFVEYLESVGIQVRNPTTGTQTSALGVVKVAPEGGKPGVYDVEAAQVVAKVEAINYLTRIITLKGPKGNSVTFQVDRSVKNFWHIKKGDEVVVDYVEALAITVQTPQESTGK